MEQKQRPSDRDVAEENDSITIPVQMINDIQAQLNKLNEAMHALKVQVELRGTGVSAAGSFGNPPIQKTKVSSFNAQLVVKQGEEVC